MGAKLQTSFRLFVQWGIGFLPIGKWVAGLAVLLLLNTTTQAADVGYFGVIKGQTFVQSSSSLVVADGSASSVFQAIASPAAPGNLANATFRTPASTLVTIPNNSGVFAFEKTFSSVTAMDSVYPNGNYTLTLGTVHDGVKTAIVTLSANNYPATPRFNNFTTAQAINSSADFTLGWDPIPANIPPDLLQVLVLDCHSNLVFSTPFPGSTGALASSSVSAIISARTLRPGQQYNALMLVLRPVNSNTNSYPGAVGVAGFYKQLRMPLVTTGTSVGCPNGDFRLVFNVPHGSFGNSTNGIAIFPQGISNYAALFTLNNDTNRPAAISFTGPAKSGLTNSLNQTIFSLAGNSLSYLSPAIPTPAFPTGGVFTVKYGNSTNRFNLLNPNAATQQTILIPTVVLNASNVVKKINWTYKNTGGTTITPPAYIKGIQIRIDGFTGPIYSVGDFLGAIPPTTNSHTLTQTVLWNNVKGIQLSFNDTPANLYASYFEHLQASAPVIDSMNSLTNGPFHFRLNGSPGFSHILLRSTNLTTWTPFLTNSVPASGFLDISDPAQPASPCYYRAQVIQ
jgi:hypothetical protein